MSDDARKSPVLLRPCWTGTPAPLPRSWSWTTCWPPRHRLDAVVELCALDSELEQRMLKRAKEQGRKDDTIEVFRRRLDLYHRETW